MSIASSYPGITAGWNTGLSQYYSMSNRAINHYRAFKLICMLYL